VNDQAESLQKRIAEVESRLADARKRIPKHTPPPALFAEIDRLEEELARLRAQLQPPSLPEQIAEVEKRLADARARVPKHSLPTALMAEIDALEEELERLRSQVDTGS
jgi:uncharacterized coiled-coil DUF342 family protein